VDPLCLILNQVSYAIYAFHGHSPPAARTNPRGHHRSGVEHDPRDPVADQWRCRSADSATPPSPRPPA